MKEKKKVGKCYFYNCYLFYCKNCTNNFEFDIVWIEDFCKICFKRFFSKDKSVYCGGCFKWIHCKFVSIPNKSLTKICKNVKIVILVMTFFSEDCDLNMYVCYRCNLDCKDSENCLT